MLRSAVLGLDRGRQVYAVRDAMGPWRAESKETALRRMELDGAEIVNTEMVVSNGSAPPSTRGSAARSISFAERGTWVGRMHIRRRSQGG